MPDDDRPWLYVNAWDGVPGPARWTYDPDAENTRSIKDPSYQVLVSTECLVIVHWLSRDSLHIYIHRDLVESAPHDA